MQTTRLVLRDLRDEDAPALVRALTNFNISRNTSSIPYPYTHADAVNFIARQKAKTSASIKKVVALKTAPDELVGSVRLHIEPANKHCELGYWIAEPYWGKGYATEAAAFMVRHAFKVLKFSTIFADYNCDNPTSGRVLQRLGFVEIGFGEDFSVAQGRSVPITLLKLTPSREA